MRTLSNRLFVLAAASVLCATAQAQITNQDDCANSGLDNVGPGIHAFDTSAATTGLAGQADCLASGSTVVDFDVWFCYRPASAGTATLSTCSASGTHTDTKIVAYPGCPACPFNGSMIACNDDACGFFSEFSFPITGGAAYVIQLGSFAGAVPGSGDLAITEIPPPGTIGTSYCSPAIPNGTGLPGIITATGSIAVIDNDVTLTADQLPVNFGYFLNSQTQGFFNPPGSNGFICLGGAVGRYNQSQNIIVGPTGSIQIDLTAVPQPAGLVAVVPGETWNFQAWYRDVGNTNNFTDAVSVLFQ